MPAIISSFKAAWRAKLALAAVFLAASLLQACAGATVHSPYRKVDNLSSFLTYAAPEGEAQLEILGNPFDTSDQTLAQALIGGFNGGVKYGPNLTFSTRSASARAGHRFVIAFGTTPTLDADSLCGKARPVTLMPKQRPIQARAAFCVNAQAYSEVSGGLGDISGPDHPYFRQWARNIMAGLTPVPDEFYRTDN